MSWPAHCDLDMPEPAERSGRLTQLPHADADPSINGIQRNGGKKLGLIDLQHTQMLHEHLKTSAVKKI